MPLDHHPLITEFPNQTDIIHNLKAENAHFQRLMNEYEEIDKEVRCYEEKSRKAGIVQDDCYGAMHY